MLSFYFDAWVKYCDFSGKASRQAFWMFVLVNLMISAVLSLLEWTWPSAWRLEALYGLAIFLPMLAITVRRLRDTQRSAWWLAVIMIPAFGMLILWILLAMPGQSDSAKPKQDTFPQNSSVQ
ncbi:DUF805 domain-containing protein [Marinomonas sp. THO17]|uniref:DUF805 domain-containing protein n=1 Tax=Marinomonas sp. THO17 TaxID=3149048 RepID=UPI00336BCA76